MLYHSSTCLDHTPKISPHTFYTDAIKKLLALSHFFFFLEKKMTMLSLSVFSTPNSFMGSSGNLRFMQEQNQSSWAILRWLWWASGRCQRMHHTTHHKGVNRRSGLAWSLTCSCALALPKKLEKMGQLHDRIYTLQSADLVTCFGLKARPKLRLVVWQQFHVAHFSKLATLRLPSMIEQKSI